RHALGYVLLNARHHYFERHRRPPPAVRLDPASSAVWFEGWKRRLWHPGDSPPRIREVAPAATWLLTKGWRRHRLIDPAEIPGRCMPPARFRCRPRVRSRCYLGGRFVLTAIGLHTRIAVWSPLLQGSVYRGLTRGNAGSRNGAPSGSTRIRASGCTRG